MKNYLNKFIFALKHVFIASPFIFLFSILAMIISGISPVITTYFTAQIVKILANGGGLAQKSQELIFMILIIVGSSALNFLSSNIKNSLSDILGCRLSHNIENIISEKSQKIPHEVMDAPSFLNLYRNTVDKVGYEPINIIYSLMGVIASLVSLVSYFIILCSFNPIAPIILLLTYIPIYFLRQHVQIKDHNFFKESTMNVRQIWYHFSLMSEKKYAKEIRILDLFPFLKKSRDYMFKKLMQWRNKIVVHNMICIVFTSFLALIGPGIIEIWIILSAVKGDVSVSEFILFNGSVISLVYGIISLTDLFISNKRSMLFLDFLFEFLKLREDTIESSVTLNQKPTYTFEFKNVFFKYPEASSFCLQNVNFVFHTGQKICLVGENGSGKSTLVKLLLRIYKPSEGQILINGIDIQNYTLDSYYKLFGVVFQDYINFSLNVKKCIGFGNIDKLNDLDNIISLSKKIGTDDFIQKYKDNYETNLSRDFYDNGIEPSIGQWQRLAIARGFYSNAPVLIMDEPTASLDPEAEEKVFTALEEYSKNKATFIISHRMSSAKFADKIILLEHGEVSESGSHSELMKNKKKYFEMYSLQAQKYSET